MLLLMSRSFSPHPFSRQLSWGYAPGWYEPRPWRCILACSCVVASTTVLRILHDELVGEAEVYD